MYYIKGKRKSGLEISKKYDNLNIANFEFEAKKCIADYLVLSDETKGYEQLGLYIN